MIVRGERDREGRDLFCRSQPLHAGNIVLRPLSHRRVPVHGFAKLAVEGKFDASVEGKGRERVIKVILEPMLAYLWPVKANG